MSDFKKGQIVYVSDDKKEWFVSHYAGSYDSRFYVVDNKENLPNDFTDVYGFQFCISIEDYEKMLKTPKDKQPVCAFDDNMKFMQMLKFYDAKNNRTFDSQTGKRNSFGFDNYEPIPEDKIPEWMIEAQKHLED